MHPEALKNNGFYRTHYFITRCSSKESPWTASLVSPRDLVEIQDSQAPPQTDSSHICAGRPAEGGPAEPPVEARLSATLSIENVPILLCQSIFSCNAILEDYLAFPHMAVSQHHNQSPADELLERSWGAAVPCSRVLDDLLRAGSQKCSYWVRKDVEGC